MDPVFPELPEWEVPKAIPVVTQEPYMSLVNEVFGRDIVNLKGAGTSLLLLIVLMLWRRTVRRPFQ